jgi:hypothetical protein
MNTIKLTFAAAVFTLGLATSASALPVNHLGGLKAQGIQVDQVRLVCNRWGRCWHVGGYSYRYGYHRYHGYRRGWRRW